LYRSSSFSSVRRAGGYPFRLAHDLIPTMNGYVFLSGLRHGVKNGMWTSTIAKKGDLRKERIPWLRSESSDRAPYSPVSRTLTTTCISMGTFTSGRPLSRLNSDVPGGDSYYESRATDFVGAIASQEPS